jgi:diguanylate cyclase (GGDEF)-like protein
MRTNPKSPFSHLHHLAGLVLVIALLLESALYFSNLVPRQESLIPALGALLNYLASATLGAGTAFVAFASGALAVAFILLPIQHFYRARETLLLRERERLAADNAKLARQAASDGLLGIANRREFDRVLKLEWRRAARERQPLSLLMIDIDCFKCFNDSYGHQEGDACLRGVAAVLQAAAARPGDLVARYGGEEMAVLMPHTDLEGASRLAERIHALLAERRLSFPDSPVASHVTVSIGVAAMLPVRNANRAALIRQADEGLYIAKENGRNRTAIVPHLRLISTSDSENRATGHAQGA